MNRSFIYYTLFDILIYFCMFEMLDGNSIVLVVLVLRGKEFYEVAKRYLKGYNLRNEEILVIGAYAIMFLFVYLFRITQHLMLVFSIIGAGAMFYINEEALQG